MNGVYCNIMNMQELIFVVFLVSPLLKVNCNVHILVIVCAS